MDFHSLFPATTADRLDADGRRMAHLLIPCCVIYFSVIQIIWRSNINVFLYTRIIFKCPYRFAKIVVYWPTRWPKLHAGDLPRYRGVQYHRF